MKEIRNLFVGAVVGVGLMVGLRMLQAQETTTTIQGNPNVLPASTVDSMSDLEVLLQTVELLPTVPAKTAPRGGTFWSAQHAPGTKQPWPPLPLNARNSRLWSLGDDVFLMSDLNVNYNAPLYSSATTAGGTMMAMDSGDGLAPNGSTNIFVPAFNPPTIADYGTNLWIDQARLAKGSVSGVLSNSFADIQYEIQYITDLSQTNWQSAGWFVYGSELTNWTPFNVPALSSSNLFLRVRSWQDDGSGLPIWWQLQYFGTSGVDPYGNPAGDGWNNLQKFQNGMNPNQFYTPPAPQGLSVVYHPADNTAAISWQPSPGSVIGYTVTRNNNGSKTTFNFSSPTTTSFTDTTQPQTPNLNDRWAGPVSYNPTYQVQANYTGSHVSASSVSVPLLSPQNAVAISLGSDSQGTQHLVLSDIPQDTAALQVTRIGPWNQSDNAQGDTAATSYNIPVSSLNNGDLALSGAQAIPPDGSFYAWWVQTVNSSGVPSDARNSNGQGILASSAAQPLFYDGRRQLKDNLIFLLREANANYPFQVGLFNTNGAFKGVFTAPTNYSFASYYQNGVGLYGGDTVDVFRPFEDNYFYRNFVFSPADIDTNGNLNTGVGQVFNSNFFYGLLFAPPPAYQFQQSAAGTNITSLLRSNDTRWLAVNPMIWIGGNFAPNGLSVSSTYDPVFNHDGEPVFNYNGNVSNYWGLPFNSTKFYYYDDYDYLHDTILTTGDSVATWGPIAFYTEAAQPQFQTVEYDFWNPNAVWKETLVLPALPGDPDFSPTSKSGFLIAGIADPNFQVAGYAKLAVANGYPGVYAYLGQYFNAAYTEDANGVATTNSAGFLTPYGNFFATQIGRAALVTMPDPDTGEQGTDTVYVVGLALDKNHDGNMDLSLAGSDYTSPDSPYVFWCNNNFDRWNTTYNPLYTETEQDDVLPGTTGDQNLDPNDPDCDYKVNGYRAIPSTRDLEDFARLWICGVTSNLLAALPSGSTVTLSWAGRWDGYEYVYSNYPTIDLFQAADPGGGIGYLTNETAATAQLDPYQGSYVGRLVPGGSIQLNANNFGSTWAGDHFIWCGVSNGTGGLTLIITDGNSNVLGQSTVYIQIKDIKDMYERWTVGDNPNIAPLNVATNAANDLPAGEMPFHYAAPQDTNTPYILHVHGYNMTPFDKDRYAETEFKRLYWQGYQGRFGEFRWPTTLQNLNPRAFDNSESQAWNSAHGLLNLLTSLNAEYPGNVYLTAHSHGNVVAGEALRLVTQQGLGQVVNTYVAMQGAVDAHTYDPTTPTRSVSFGTPDRYGQYYVNGATNYFNGSAGAGTYVNFFNTNDWALNTSIWQRDQNQKPDIGYGYDGTNFFYQPFLTRNYFYFPGDTYNIFSYCDQAHGYALGAQPDVGGAFLTLTNYNQVNLPNVWPADLSGHSYGDHLWHSAEFRSDYPQRWLFWDEVLFQMRLKTHL